MNTVIVESTTEPGLIEIVSQGPRGPQGPMNAAIRPYDFNGIIFSATGVDGNVLRWTGGAIINNTDAETSEQVEINPNLVGVTFSGQPLYVYFDGTSELKTTTVRAQARGLNEYANTGNVWLVSFHGYGQILSVWGTVTIHGDVIQAGTLRGDRIIAGEINASHIAARTLTAANIAVESLTADLFEANQLFIGHDMQVGSGVQQVHMYRAAPEGSPFPGKPCVIVGDATDPVNKAVCYVGLDDGQFSTGAPVPVLLFTGGQGNERMKIGKLTNTEYGVRVRAAPPSGSAPGTNGEVLFDTSDVMHSLWPSDFSVNGNVFAWDDRVVLARDGAQNQYKVSAYRLSISGGWMEDVHIVNPQEGQILKFMDGQWKNVNP